MAHINLLPWRDERREELKKQYLTILGITFVAAALVVVAGDRIVNGQIDYQKARNDYLTKNIRVLDRQVEEIKDLQRRRNQLIDRMRVIQELQGNRPIIVRVMDQLVRTVPDGVFYTTVTSAEGKINIQGVAESNNRVSSLMRRLAASEWLEAPNLDRVTAAPAYGEQANTFNLTVSVSLPTDENDAAAGD
jgi:type IV pilus assembly protein PilN